MNVNLLSLESEERIIIEENSWENIGRPLDLRSPPQGKELEVIYSNGDYLCLRFIELLFFEQAQKRYDTDIFKQIKFPITAVEVDLKIAGTNIILTPSSSQLGAIQMKGCLLSHCGGGVVLEKTGINWLQNPIWKRQSLVEETEHQNVIKVNFSRR